MTTALQAFRNTYANGLSAPALPNDPIITQSGLTSALTVKANAGTNSDISALLGISGAGVDVRASEVNLNSATTTDLGSVTAMRVAILGNTTITAFGSTPNCLRYVRFAASLTLTHNGTSLILPAATNIATAPGDSALLVSDASGNWRVFWYQKADGTALVGSSLGTLSYNTSQSLSAAQRAQAKQNIGTLGSNQVNVGAATTLLASAANALIYLSGSSYTVTLPLITAVGAGETITFVNNSTLGSGPITIALATVDASGSTARIFAGGGGLLSLAVYPSQCLSLVMLNGGWYPLGYDAPALTAVRVDLAQSFSTGQQGVGRANLLAAGAGSNYDITGLYGISGAGVDLRTAESTITASSTTDLGTISSLRAVVTGNSAITSFGSTANCLRYLRFASTATLTHNATTLALPTQTNIVASAGDVAVVASDGSGNWRVLNYSKSDGTPLAGAITNAVTYTAQTLTSPQQIQARSNLAAASSGANTDISSITADVYSTSTTLASATTTDIGATPTRRVAISGTTSVTSFGTRTNRERLITFTGAMTLVHNSATLSLPTAANITTAVGDSAMAVSDPSGNWMIAWYQRADGSSLLGNFLKGSNNLSDVVNAAQARLNLGAASLEDFYTIAVQAAMSTGFSLGTPNGFFDPFSTSNNIDFTKSSGFYVDPSAGALIGGVGAPSTVLESKPSYPPMTGPTSVSTGVSGYAASASTEYSTNYQAWMAFDGNPGIAAGTMWESTTVAGTQWLQIKFPTAIKFAGYAITTNTTTTYSPTAWTLVGSNDGSTWTTIDTQSSQTFTGRALFTIATINQANYLYYRLNFTGVSSNGLEIGELEYLQLAPMVESQSSLPAMASNTTTVSGVTGHVAFASSTHSSGSYPAWAAFRTPDGSASGVNKTWQNNESPYTLPAWVGRQTPQPIRIGAYSIVGYWDGTYTFYPNTWQVQGSNDNTTWVTLDSQSYANGGAPLGSGKRGTWLIAPQNQGSYLYHRLYITSTYNNGNSSLEIALAFVDFQQVLTGVEATTSLPLMTAASTPTGHAVTQINGQVSEPTYNGWRAMDGDPAATGYIGISSSSAPWSFTRQVPSPIKALAYTIVLHTSYVLYLWQLQGSNDGTTWQTIDNRSAQYSGSGTLWDAQTGALGNRKTFAVTSPGFYSYYRLNMTSSNNVPLIYDFQLLQGTTGNLTLYSKTYANPKGVPTKLCMIAGIKNTTGSFTINTNVKGAVSRDGGTNLRNVTLNAIGPINGYTMYTSSYIDMTDLPSGSSLLGQMITNDGLVGIGVDYWGVIGIVP